MENKLKNVKSNEKLILDVKNEVDIIKHSLQNIVIELKKLNGKTVLDPTQIKRSNMVMVEVNTGYDSYGVKNYTQWESVRVRLWTMISHIRE